MVILIDAERIDLRFEQIQIVKTEMAMKAKNAGAWVGFASVKPCPVCIGPDGDEALFIKPLAPDYEVWKPGSSVESHSILLNSMGKNGAYS